jgi:peptidoglycan DL-endopeptidase CwlO
VTDTLSGIEGWIAQVGAALQSLPSALEEAAPTGGFAAVLSSVQQMLDGSPPTAASTTTTPTEATMETSASPSGSDVVADAEQYLGVPYQWGGTSPSGFDCSGLVQYVYAQLGVNLPRTSEQQATVGTAVPSLADAQPCDLVFFAGSDGTASSPGHVGIYIGNGEMIDAPYTGAAVRIDPVGDPVTIRRVLSPATSEAPVDGSTSSANLLGALVTSGAASGTGGTSSALSGVPAALAPLFVSAAGTYGVPATLLVAVARQESNFDTGAVSSAGAEGLMQLMPQTAASLGVDPMDPAQAVDGAAQLLSGYLRQYGSVPLALAAYNAGPGAVAEYGGVPPYPETESYVSSIMASLGGAT